MSSFVQYCPKCLLSTLHIYACTCMTITYLHHHTSNVSTLFMPDACLAKNPSSLLNPSFLFSVLPHHITFSRSVVFLSSPLSCPSFLPLDHPLDDTGSWTLRHYLQAVTPTRAIFGSFIYFLQILPEGTVLDEAVFAGCMWT